jgi:hypothetical protein
LLTQEIEASHECDLRRFGATMLRDQQPGHRRIGALAGQRRPLGLSGNGSDRANLTVVVLVFAPLWRSAAMGSKAPF